MAVPLGAMRQPNRALLTAFLLEYYGFKEPLAPRAPMVEDPLLRVRSLEALVPFGHTGRSGPFRQGDRAFLGARIEEVERAGGKLWNGPLARITSAQKQGGQFALAFGAGRYHDYIAGGEAMAVELMRAWAKATRNVGKRSLGSDARKRAFFERVGASLPLRAALAPDREGLRDFSRRVVKVGVVAATMDGGRRMLLMHHRSRKVGEYPGLWSSLPGGSIEPGARRVQDVLRAETLEELGVATQGKVAPKRVLLAWDLLSCKLDFLLMLERPPGFEQATKSWESREIRWVGGREAARFEREEPLTPHAAVGLAWAKGRRVR